LAKRLRTWILHVIEKTFEAFLISALEDDRDRNRLRVFVRPVDLFRPVQSSGYFARQSNFIATCLGAAGNGWAYCLFLFSIAVPRLARGRIINARGHSLIRRRFIPLL
jgi:hypothetical protein